MQRRQIAVRFKPETFSRIEGLAKNHGCSLNDAICNLVTAGLRVRLMRAQAASAAATYETKARKARENNMRQQRIVPEPQLSELKARHWRLLEKIFDEDPGLT